jgi:2-oxoisovalerate dehydrogenase E1 component
MFDRAKIVDQNFTRRVLAKDFPKNAGRDSYPLEPTRTQILDCFESQMMSRHLDLVSRDLKEKQQSFYTIGSSGHEGNAVCGLVFRYPDMAFLHYRSGAFFIQRAKKLPGQTPLYDLLLSFVASKDDPIAGGRHKVLGSKPLFMPPQTSTIASHLPKAVGAAFSIGLREELENSRIQLHVDGANGGPPPRAANEHGGGNSRQGPHETEWMPNNHDLALPADSLVLCSFGDATLNHASALSAINSARLYAFQKTPLPIVFVCEDNGLGISVKTKEGWIAAQMASQKEIEYLECDGLSILDVFYAASQVEKLVRAERRPAFLHMKLVRLLGHAGSDIETTYHSLDRIASDEAQDPLLHSARLLVERSYLPASDIVEWYEALRAQVARIAEEATRRPKLETITEVKKSIVPGIQKTPTLLTSEEQREKMFGREFAQLKEKPFHMAKLINWALADILLQYPQALVFGEDVGVKGGVYYVTADLKKKFGDKRVFDTHLDETSILGLAMGLAHNNFIPLPEIQFLAYVHNAEDQIRGEAATLSFFSQGQFVNPMVVRIAGLPYQKGFGGHFHNDNSLAVLRDIPGLIIACPSNGVDAAKMLRTLVREAHEHGRVCIFIEPIALYMTRDLYEPKDGLWAGIYPSVSEEIPVGAFGVYGLGSDLAIITYGNGVYYSRQAEKILAERHGIKLKIVDLRWIAPIDEVALAKELTPFSKILIVDECRRTGSLAEGLAAMIIEKISPCPKVKIVAAEDCFIPLGLAAAVGLPSRDSIVAAALALA